MKATEIPLDIELLDSSLRPSGEGRTGDPRDHLSEILRWMWVQLQGEYAQYDEEGNVRMMAGYLLEMLFNRVIAPYMIAAGKLAGRDVVEQKELKKDGVILTPDADDRFEKSMEEYKATWRSMRPLVDLGIARGLEEEFQLWLMQVKAACYVRGYGTAKLVPLFVNGDYRRGSLLGGPQLRCFRLEFGAQELRDNWSMVLRNRDAMRRERDEVEVEKARRKKKRGG